MSGTESNVEMRVPDSLSGKYEGSYAYRVITNRLPVILTRIVDHLFRERNQIAAVYGEDARDQTKSTIGRLSKLRNEMQTNKVVIPLVCPAPDVELWNSYRTRYIELYGKEPKWFEASWLYVECYLYRRIHEAFMLSPVISSIDPYGVQKQSSLVESLDAVVSLSGHLLSVLARQQEAETKSLKSSHYLEQFLQVSLWGNMCDLSLSGGEDRSQSENPLTQTEQRKANILVNHIPEVVSLFQSFLETPGKDRELHIVLDNAGFELFTDLCLAEFLHTSGYVKTVHFYVKCMPWFVSDTTGQDFAWLLEHLSSSREAVLSKLGKKWQQNIANSNWIIVKELFWTLPHDFSEMKTVDSELYCRLSKADLIILKGDLNYRKLVGDRKWEMGTPIEVAVRGFHPAPFCALRTLKSDVVVGLQPAKGEELSLEGEDWMISGEYAVIQYYNPYQ